MSFKNLIRALPARFNSRAVIVATAATLMSFYIGIPAAHAQGSIFGAVTNSNATTPDSGQISFFGYLDDTDEEIRIETCDGAGYDAGNWYDDFQNYLTEAPGNPYDYHFYNSSNSEGNILSKLIPNNSFQQEDITLVPVNWPSTPTGLAGQAVSSSSNLLSWDQSSDIAYHVYRRVASSNGSLNRIDDITGSLANPGIADSFFVDSTVDGINDYDYLLIAEDTLGVLGPHSDILVISSSTVAPPEIISISPNSGTSDGGTPVIIYGRGFDMAGAVVTIDGSELTSIVVISPYEITGVTPAGSAGPADVIATNTASGLSSSALAGGFTYEFSTTPAVDDIPDQIIPEGSTFSSVHLDDYVSDPDHTDEEIVWSYSGNVELTVSINVNRIADIQIPDPEWSGSETITFRATDPDLLFDEDAAVFTVTIVNDTPVVADIPDQAIVGAGSYASIILDNYVADVDDVDSVLNWSYGGNSDLSVDVTDRVAALTITNPDWSGTETVTFRATDPGGEFGENQATFVQVKVDAAELDFGNVLLGWPDSLLMVVTTPAGFVLTAPQIIPSKAEAVVRREDGGVVDGDIPPSTSRGYWIIWDPADTADTPGSITISSVSVDDTEVLTLNGQAVSLSVNPEFADYNFGDVNSLDIRAADTLRAGIDISGNIGGTITEISFESPSGDFMILAPLVGDSLSTGSNIELVVLSYPQNNGSANADIRFSYEINLGNAVQSESSVLMSLSATGVEPGCAITQDTLEFYSREIGTMHNLSFTLFNSSTVYEVVDSIYLDTYTNIFWIDSSLIWPLYIPPGNTDITVFFKPLDELLYTTGMVVIDSILSGNCDPPVVRGSGVQTGVHWEPESPVALGLTYLCESSRIMDYRIVSHNADFDMIVDNIEIDSSGWFRFYPDFATIIGSAYRESEIIIFDSILFEPRDILPPTNFGMTLTYIIDTVGAPIEALEFNFVSQTGGCAGIINQISDLDFGAVDVGETRIDTIVLQNSGNCDLTIESLVLDIGEFSAQIASLPLMISPGSVYNMEVTYAPSDTGIIDRVLTLYHNSYSSPFDQVGDCPLAGQTVINLSGVGIDDTPPQISEIIPHACGQILEIIVTDIGVGVQSVSTTWRRGNALGGFIATTATPLLIGADHWQLQFSDNDLSPDSVNILGYEIRVVIYDGAGNFNSAVNSISGCLSMEIDGGARISAENWLGGDGLDSMWHLVSFPGYLPTYQAGEIFENFSGLPPAINSDDDTWRLYEYRNGGFNVIRSNDPSAEIEPGRGYWFRHFMALDTLCLNTTGAAMTWATLPSFEISLEYGWNLIGSPYLFPVYIDDTMIDVDSVSSFISQTAPAPPGGRNWWEITNIGDPLPPLLPWNGYALWCENPAGYALYLSPHHEPVQASDNNNQVWAVSISLSKAEDVIGKADLGINLQSSNGPDLSDVRSVTFFNKGSGLIVNSEPYGEFIRDFRPDADLQTWELDLSDESRDPLTLSWAITGGWEPGKSLVIHDAVTGEVVDMSSTSEFRVNNSEQLPDGRYRVYWGRDNLVKAAIQSGPPARPMVYRLYQNYPNPFNPVTSISYDLPRPGQVTIDIFNILGQRVVRLEDNHREAGSYQTFWDGKGAPSGVYFYRIQAGNFSDSRKMILLK